MDFIEIDSVTSKEAFTTLESSHCPTSSSETNLHSEQLCENANELSFNEETDINSSLFILTTHLAQVQFRLKQILETPNRDKSEQLKSLEEFTFQGISNVGILRDYKTEENLDCIVKSKHEALKNSLKMLRCQIHQLRKSLSELNKEHSLQIFMVNEQSKVIKDLKHRSSKNVNLRRNKKSIVMKELLTNLSLKEEFILELKTHIRELENVIDHNKEVENNCKCKFNLIDNNMEDNEGILQRFLSILQIVYVIYLDFHKKICCKSKLEKSIKVKHWGDLRAKLEIAIHLVKQLAEKNKIDKKLTTTKKLTREERIYLVDIHLIVAIRKNLTTAFRDLMQHGLVGSKDKSIVPMINCFERRRNKVSLFENQMHAWEVIIAYYNLKNGDKINSSAHFKLSESFNLNIHGIAGKNNNKNSLLVVIKRIISSHTIHKRNSDLQLKAFICAGLNANKLVPWLTLIFQCNQLIKLHYLPWSYVAETHFRDSLKSLDLLSHFQFDLPVDLAVQQFQDIKDVFF